MSVQDELCPHYADKGKCGLKCHCTHSCDDHNQSWKEGEFYCKLCECKEFWFEGRPKNPQFCTPETF